jgi:hypothetical protein
MPLVPCSSCGTHVRADEADPCPHCGGAHRASRTAAVRVLGLAVGAGLLGSCSHEMYGVAVTDHLTEVHDTAATGHTGDTGDTGADR